MQAQISAVSTISWSLVLRCNDTDISTLSKLMQQCWCECSRQRSWAAFHHLFWWLASIRNIWGRVFIIIFMTVLLQFYECTVQAHETLAHLCNWHNCATCTSKTLLQSHVLAYWCVTLIYYTGSLSIDMQSNAYIGSNAAISLAVKLSIITSKSYW